MITNLGLESQMVSEPATGFAIDTARSSCHAGDSIARGKSCTVYISFTPSAQGASADNLVVTGNFLNSGEWVALIGIGYSRHTMPAGRLRRAESATFLPVGRVSGRRKRKDAEPQALSS